MGWTFTRAESYKNGRVDRKAECDALYTWSNDTARARVVKSTMKGRIYYGAIEVKDVSGERSVFCAVVITSGSDKNNPYFNFGYKAMDESMIPGYYDCPRSILNLLTPTDNEGANEWRRLCLEQLNKEVSWLKTLPCGSKIKWKDGRGIEHILQKCEPAYQFKTWWWLNVNSGGYVPKKYVTEGNSCAV